MVVYHQCCRCRAPARGFSLTSLTHSLTLALSAMVGPQGDRCASAAPSGIVHNGLDAFPALVPLDKDPPAMIRAGFQGCGTFKYGYGGSCATLVLVGRRRGNRVPWGAINEATRHSTAHTLGESQHGTADMECIVFGCFVAQPPTLSPLGLGGQWRQHRDR
jgi:hypothetical protein